MAHDGPIKLKGKDFFVTYKREAGFVSSKTIRAALFLCPLAVTMFFLHAYFVAWSQTLAMRPEV